MGNHVHLGKAIARLRRERGLTQDDLSSKAGISYSTLAKLERGAITAPSIFTMADIAEVLGVSLDEIVNPNKFKPKIHKTSQEIKFVYCDVNGVLVRFYYKAFSRIARLTGANVDKVEAAFWHYNDAANRGEISTAEFNHVLEKRLGLKTGTIDWEKHYLASVEPILLMHSCLENIAKTHKVGLLSDNFEGFLDKMITKGLLPTLDYATIIESASCKSKKPDQKIYEIAEKQAGVSGDNIFFIDDSRANLVEAEKRGWKVLWFDDYNPEDSVRRVNQALTNAS